MSAQDNDVGTPGVEPHENENDIDTDNNQPMIEQLMDAKYGPCNRRYDMRRRKQREYSHLFMTKDHDGNCNTNYYECLYNDEEEEDDEDVPADGDEMEREDDDEPLATPQMSMKTHSGTEAGSARVPNVLETKTVWTYQGAWMCRWT